MKIDEVDDALVRHLNIPRSRVKNVHRVLREASLVSPGAHGASPETDEIDVLTMVTALGTGAPLSRIARSTAEYLATTPGGAVLTGAPASICETAQIYLAALVSDILEGRDPSLSRLEIVQEFPEIRVIYMDGTCIRFQRKGALSNHPERKNWTAAVFDGAAFTAIFKELFV
ncbi:hypothetical protein [Gellertiella hungarica]|uniref:Uncharacterized protein n=1 Tax=Gellertiella hungarica TaxID=1572859 RepID=A0A7W6JBH9_9HYPH|nr:hypothetical protein [Gellertiella hungarica]MBB4067416.1 hypothetical protein [Gellertiella hungarica]